MKSDSNRFIAHKRLGQHFLVDDQVVEKTILAAKISDSDTILEVGPGPGILTRALLRSNANSITSIEIDRQFWPSLELIKDPRFSLIKKDALQVPLGDISSKPVKIIANLPYNIGNKLIINWLAELSSIDTITVMLQEEVVQRLSAQPGTKDYGRISILVQWLCEVTPLFQVPPESFKPAPKVMSAVVQIVPRDKPIYEVDQVHLEKLTNIMFQQRRKMVGGILKKLGHPKLEHVFQMVKVKESMRPEEISIPQFCQMAQLLKDYL